MFTFELEIKPKDIRIVSRIAIIVFFQMVSKSDNETIPNCGNVQIISCQYLFFFETSTKICFELLSF
ncbi:MAG: hypothetical protein ABR94_08035 [Sphingobacteriales bacterium BACL12 MAG-120802-bin5]|nr:MAG: hypothetical protein ABR94_08035 [Sphingobacteriales bacterium BACL12 MAG-120802-bin5]